MSRDSEKKMLVQDFERDFVIALDSGQCLEEQDRENYLSLWKNNSSTVAKDPSDPMIVGIVKLLRPNRALEEFAANRHKYVLDGRGAAFSPSETPGLEGEEAALDRSVRARMQADGVDYYTAIVRVTGNDDLQGFGDVPGSLPDFSGSSFAVDEEQYRHDAQARAMVRLQLLGYTAALDLVQLDDEIQQVELEQRNVSDVPWLDVRPLTSPPRPWSEEDWERDKRRAAAAGVELSREEWAEAAGQGRDLIPELATEARESVLGPLRASRQSYFQHARRTEVENRKRVINEALKRRAHDRLMRP